MIDMNRWGNRLTTGRLRPPAAMRDRSGAWVRPILLWVVTGLLVFIPVAYVVWHLGVQSIRDAAITGWFGTVIGVVIGVPFALWLVRVQQRSQEEAERARQLMEHKEAMGLLTHRMFEEVVFNLEQLATLGEVLRESGARADLWAWAVRVVDSFEASARMEFERFVLTPKEHAADAPVEGAYRDLQRLAGWVKRAEAGHAFLYGYSANEKEAERQLSEVRNYLQIVTTELMAAKAQLEKREGAA